MTLADFATILGWCTLINLGLLALSTLLLMILRGPVTSIHAVMFGIPKDTLNTFYFLYLAVYKLLIVVFNLVPYLVLRLIIL